MAEFKHANQSTQAAFQIVETMAEHGGSIGLSDLSRRMGMPRARVHRFLRTLLEMGYVSQDPQTEQYRLTLKIYHVGQAVADSTALVTEARPVLMRLRDEVRQSISLSAVESEGMRILDLIRVETSVQIVLRPGALLPFHASAQGKLALAFGNMDAWSLVRSEPLTRYTSQTCTDPGELMKTVESARINRWAEAPEEMIPGLNAIAAPVFDSTGQLVATIAIAGLVNIITSPPNAAFIEKIGSAANSISTRLGWTGKRK